MIELDQPPTLYVWRAPPSATWHRREHRPWVARITGLSTRYGLRRSFIRPLQDWTAASWTCRGKARDVVATYPLTVGWVVEVSHVHPRKPRMLRYFARVTADGLEEITAEEVQAWALTCR